jgi:hypothetical protein
MIKPFDTKFNGKGDKVKPYIERISEYASSGGMTVLFTVADPITGAPRDFLKQYGAIPIIDVRMHINGIYSNTTSVQDAQDDQMLFTTLSGSLTEDFKREVKADHSQYMVTVVS